VRSSFASLQVVLGLRGEDESRDEVFKTRSLMMSCSRGGRGCALPGESREATGNGLRRAVREHCSFLAEAMTTHRRGLPCGSPGASKRLRSATVVPGKRQQSWEFSDAAEGAEATHERR